jgi:NAD(P)-dependent dehydrogenase (short-subunit alcohol dehydrogenase family)
MTVKTALVTGASSGIGKATAERLLKAGYITYASARRPEALEPLRALGCHALRLDVTDEASMVEAVSAITAEHGAVDVLVNNAGYGVMGAIEEVPLADWRRQFETNVFGLVRLTQLVLPGMRAKRSGRIINISSGGGEFTFPLAGAYHASKYAVESISDALRFEVRCFGIQVIVVQPGVVDTPLAAATVDAIQTAPTSPYAPLINSFRQLSAQSHATRQGYVTPEAVAEVIVGAAQAARPRTRYKVGSTPRLMSTMRHLLSDPLWDRMVARFYNA